MTATGAGATGEWRVGDDEAGGRLDRALASRLAVPRNQVQAWIAAGRVTVGGKPAGRPGVALRAGDLVAWSAPPAADDRIEPEAGPLAVTWSDDDLLVLDKPADLVVHPGAGRRSGTLVHRLLAAYPELAGVGGPGRPGIVHRLDRGTTGCLVVARTRFAYEALTRSFAERDVDKRYLAIVWGRPRAAAGTISAPIGRHPHDRQRMAVRERGRPAETRWRTRAAAGPVALLELELITGRTHQIRVHAKHFGHPLVGDAVYGEERHHGVRGPTRRVLAEFPRPALHAWKLSFPHPRDGRRVSCVAPLPADLAALWSAATGADVPEL
ncbi:MAG: RluA family pseudouridine synthase [Thermoanaerobaculia bacterium]|nr:RluA family pseudouridine synthase [Thermoanaerobaculia bacterium]